MTPVFPKKVTLVAGTGTGGVNAAAVTEDIVTISNSEDAKAFVPILVTELGIVIDLKLLQVMNAC